MTQMAERPARDTNASSEESGEAMATAKGSRERTRCLLIHGFNGEPVDMVELDGYLSGLGFATKNLLLPGHGTSVRDFATHGWADWCAAVEVEVQQALGRGEQVILIGHSMGASVSLALAAQESRVLGVAALCPPLSFSPFTYQFVRTMRRVIPYFPSWREDIRDRRGAHVRYARNAYAWTALSTVESLLAALPELREALPALQCPALVVCARRDHVVPLRDGLETFQLLGSEDKELLVLDHSYHAVTKDIERHRVFARVMRFCERIQSIQSAVRGDTSPL
jgi:carboxylesterase